MAGLLLQPCAGADARRHYRDTVQHGLPLERMTPLVDEQLAKRLIGAAQRTGIAAWGVTPGNNTTKWNRIEPGDIALFGAQRRVFASAAVVATSHNPALAAELWGEDDQGRTWEHMYFLTDVREQDLSQAPINDLLGYEPDYTWLGFQRLSTDKASAVLQAYEFGQPTTVSDSADEVVTADQYSEAVAGLLEEGGTDEQRRSWGRREQTFLRNFLFGGKNQERCALCARYFPVQFLTTAHVKPRSQCSEAERLDYQHVVMPLCRFGCDELFERGYIVVDEGQIRQHRHLPDGYAATYAAQMVGRSCEYWSEATRPYFEARTALVGELLD